MIVICHKKSKNRLILFSYKHCRGGNLLLFSYCYVNAVEVLPPLPLFSSITKHVDVMENIAPNNQIHLSRQGSTILSRETRER